MKYPSWCRRCIAREGAEMLTGYSLECAPCDKCGSRREVAIIIRPCVTSATQPHGVTCWPCGNDERSRQASYYHP